MSDAISPAQIIIPENIASIIGKEKVAFIDENKKLTLVPSPIEQKQLLFILQKTPKEHIYTRPAKGGGEWEYVTGTYVKKVLNYVFGWLWDFQIIDKGREGDQVWVLGRLTIKNEMLQPIIIKEQFGGADIKYRKGTKTPLDYRNDLKAAATDALKKCAAELGIASDVYGKNEFKDIRNQESVVNKKSTLSRKKTTKQSNHETKKIITNEKIKKLLGVNTDKEAIELINKKLGTKLTNMPRVETYAKRIYNDLLKLNNQNNGR